jgi:hypothetical protein
MKTKGFNRPIKGTSLASVFILVLSLFPLLGFVDFPQTGNKETIGMKIEDQIMTISSNQVRGELNVKVDDGAVQGKLEVFKNFNSPFVQTDMIEITAYQNQSDKIKTFEETKTFYNDGKQKSHTIKTSEPIEKTVPKGILSDFNFPSWLNTLILIIIGGGLISKNYDIHGKIIKLIKYIVLKIKAYWGSK